MRRVEKKIHTKKSGTAEMIGTRSGAWAKSAAPVLTRSGSRKSRWKKRGAVIFAK